MRFSKILRRLGFHRPWARELWFSGLALALGFGIMPALIFYAGSASLGRYEGASIRRMYESLYGGLGMGSTASWVTLLGPYAFYLLFRGLSLCWRLGARPA